VALTTILKALGLLRGISRLHGICFFLFAMIQTCTYLYSNRSPLWRPVNWILPGSDELCCLVTELCKETIPQTHFSKATFEKMMNSSYLRHDAAKCSKYAAKRSLLFVYSEHNCLTITCVLDSLSEGMVYKPFLFEGCLFSVWDYSIRDLITPEAVPTIRQVWQLFNCGSSVRVFSQLPNN